MKRIALAIALLLFVGALPFGLWRMRRSWPTASFAGRPVTALRLVDYGYQSDPNSYDANVAGQRVLDANATARVLAVLDNHATYSTRNARCFTPGLAFRFGSGTDAQHILICLACKKVGFRRGEDWFFRGLSDQGVQELRQLYDEFFPAASQPTTATTQP